MRLKRIQNDFRVFEVLRDEAEILGSGAWTLYRVTKRGLTTHEAVDRLAREAGVPPSAVAIAGLKDKDGITGQFMTVEGGKPVNLKTPELTIRPVGSAERALSSEDSVGNSFEVVLRDLLPGDMRRIRIHMNDVREHGIPAYFDDQRFGCLRHGQGFIVRRLIRGDFEGALKALLTSPSRFGSPEIENFKAGIDRRWGDWAELCRYCRDRRGFSVFEHLQKHDGDFAGAFERGVATRERTIHLFAYQSYLWNRAAAIWIRREVEADDLAWLPGDAGTLPVFRKLDEEKSQRLSQATLPLFGRGISLSSMHPEARRAYEAVFRSESLQADEFANLDLNGFRPVSQERPLLMKPNYLRGAPAEPDEIYRRRNKMRLRFTLPRGQYATLVAKRLLMPEEEQRDGLVVATKQGEVHIQKTPKVMRLWISRHCLIYPRPDGREWSGKELDEMEARRRAKFQDRDGRREEGGGRRRGGDKPRRGGQDSSNRRDRSKGYRGKSGGGPKKGGGSQGRRRGQNGGGGKPRQDRRGGGRPSKSS
ncbi:MAG: tRNA pseudouridine(13) synthase TruD [Planctomycetota bacterium]|nr:MAG: tRNA pseudouridine(13) synthase TruD [Planctomycetota bacterium]